MKLVFKVSNLIEYTGPKAILTLEGDREIIEKILKKLDESDELDME